MSSRGADGLAGTVRVWFAIAPPGVVLLFTQGWSRKAERWRHDPWARLRLPKTAVEVDAAARILAPEAVRPHAALIVDRWDTAGATTEEALFRLLEDGSHVVVLIEDRAPAAGGGGRGASTAC